MAEQRKATIRKQRDIVKSERTKPKTKTFATQIEEDDDDDFQALAPID